MFNFIFTASADSAKTGGTPWGLLMIYGAIFIVMYFVLIRPQSNKRKQQENLIKSLEVGDEITTIGGIMGKVISIKEETDSVVIETGVDKSRIRIKRWAVNTNHTKHAIETENKKAAKPGLIERMMSGKKTEDSDTTK